MRVRWALGALGLAAVACEAAPSPPVARTESAIISGTQDDADPAVVAIVQRRTACAAAPPTVLCSGTLVASRYVLTAAHCAKAAIHPGSVEVYFGSKAGIDPNARYVRVSSIATHPMWDETKRERDAALFQLAEDVAITPAALPTTPMDASMVGATMRTVGFGLVTISQGIPDGAKRESTMKLDQVNALNFRTTPGPGLTCAGDSGGPVFMNIAGRETLVGITVSGDPGCSVSATNTRVDTVVDDFIKPGLAADAGAAPMPTITPDAICSKPCTSDSDCPNQLACAPIPGATSLHCQLPSILAGSFGAACTMDSDCMGTMGVGLCARLAQTGADACRCFSPCNSPPPLPDAGSDAATSPPPSNDGGCAIRAGAAGERSFLVGLALLLLSARRRSCAPASRGARRSPKSRR